MLFNDFDVFYRAAQALLQGQDPYSVYGVYYPFPLFILFVPLAVLPLHAAQIAWTAIEFVIFVAVLKRRALLALFFLPVILTFLEGQIVMPLLAMFFLLQRGKHQGIAAAWLCIKPQLIGLLLPFLFWRAWKHDRRQLFWFGGIWLILLSASFSIQPNWVQRWLEVSAERVRSPFAPSVWGALSFLPGPLWLACAGGLTLGLLLWAYRRNDFDMLSVVNLLVNPLIVSYDLTLLTLFVRPLWMWIILTELAWIAFATSALGWWRGEGLTAVVSLVALLWLRRRRRAQCQTLALAASARGQSAQKPVARGLSAE